jgi:hypothetical protein
MAVLRVRHAAWQYEGKAYRMAMFRISDSTAVFQVRLTVLQCSG